MLFDEDDPAAHEPWKSYAAEWFDRVVDDACSARFPVIEANGGIIATSSEWPDQTCVRPGLAAARSTPG